MKIHRTVRLSSVPPGIGMRLSAGLVRYFRQERDFWMASDDVELADLLGRLRSRVDKDRTLNKAAAPLIFLIGSDLLKAQKDGLAGKSTIGARPMRAWRQRYNGLERYVRA